MYRQTKYRLTNLALLNQKLSLPGSSVCAIVKQAQVTIQQKENKRNMSLFQGGKKSCILNGYANFSTHNPWLWSCSEYFRNGITVRKIVHNGKKSFAWHFVFTYNLNFLLQVFLSLREIKFRVLPASD